MKKFVVMCLAATLLVQGQAFAAESMTSTAGNAILWVQTSAEYRALCYQAYNAALAQVKAAKDSSSSGGCNASSGKPLAIVLDCDETVVDNSPFFEETFKSLDENTSMESTLRKFGEWIASGKAKAMPGALEFLQNVDALGAAIFYVTNKPEGMKPATLTHMKSLNFPQVDDAHVLLNSGDSNKEPRFTEIEKSYNVVVYLGDSMHDFPIGMYGQDSAGRKAITDEKRADFGKKYIVLPNPMYGSWMGGMSSNYGK